MRTPILKPSFFTGLILACALGLHAANLTWDADINTTGAQDGLGVWDATTNTWLNGVNNVIWNNATPDNAIFGSGNGAAATVTNNLPNTVGSITFNAAGSGTYTISGSVANTLTLSGSPNITANVNAALNVVLAGTGFSKEGAGQLSLRPGANNTYVGTTIVDNGILALNSSTSSRILIPDDLTINSGATVTNTGSTGPVADTSTVTVNGGGTYADGADVIGTLVLNGGTVVQNSTEQFTAGSIDARSGAVIESTGAAGKLDANNLTKTTAGTVLIMSKGSASAAGLVNVAVNAGTLILDYTQSSSKLADAGTLTVSGGTLVFTNSASETVGSLILDGGLITNAATTGDLRVPTGTTFDVRSGAAYIILAGGAGRSLTKTTPGTVILAATNAYSAGTTISDGILQLGDGNVSGAINSGTITDNATLVLNPGSVTAVSSAISGSGSVTKIGGGTAALTPINSYQGSTTISNGVLSIDSDATYGDGTGTLNLSGGTLGTTASRSVTAAPVANPINVTADSTVATTSASTTVDLNLSSDSIGGTAGTLTFSNAAASGTGVFEPRFSGSSFNFTRPIVIANGSFGTTRIDSYNTIGTTQTFGGSISGTGGYRRTASLAGTGGTTVLSGNNTYTGNTDVNRGTVLVNGSLGSSSIVTVASSGTLGGNGTVNGPVTVQSGGTLSAGNGIGILAISNSLTFQAGSTNYAELDDSVPTNDLVRGITTVTYAGTLVVANLNGTLALNNTFKLFDAANYTGSFSTTNLPTLGAGLAWDTSGLLVNGTIKVVPAGVTTPTLNVSQSGNTLTFSWTGAFKLQSQTNGLSVGLSNNWFDYPGGGTSPVGVTIDPASPSVFFRLSQ